MGKCSVIRVSPTTFQRDGITAEQIRSEVDRVLASNSWKGALRLHTLLRYIVEQTLLGQQDQLKEYVIGTEVYGKNPSFDPRLDSTVRVGARQLRVKLDLYYQSEAVPGEVLISCRPGSYIPQFGRYSAAPRPLKLDRVKLLCIDDSPFDLYLLQETIRESSLRHRLSILNSAESARSFLQQNGSYQHALRPDLVLLDPDVSDGAGWDLLRIMKQDPALRRIPVLVLTASCDREHVNRAYDLQANCFMRKRFGLDDCNNLVRQLEQFWFPNVVFPDDAPSA